MSTSITKNRRNARRRNENPPLNQPRLDAPITITNAVAAGTLLTLTFEAAVSLDGTPAFTTDVAGATPVSAAQTAPNIVAITYSADISAATSITIPHRDPAIRNERGGFVVSNTFPLP